jgi:prepilin-type N-terminal cleavage/methylation domain-containing protein
MNHKRLKGFTLIELLVVVLIIGILAAIALPQYQKTVLKTRLSENLLIMRSLSTAIDEYYYTTGQFPSHISDLSLTLPNLPCNNNWCQGKYFRYGFQGTRLQSWDLTATYGILYITRFNDYIDPGFYCFEVKTSVAAQKNYCAFIGGHNKIQSPTSPDFWWYKL